MNKILIVDKLLINENIENYSKLINIFPTKVNDGAYRATKKSLKHRSINQSQLYENIYKEVYSIFKNESSYSDNEFKLIYHQYIIRFSNILIDHFIRIYHRLIDSNKYNVLYVNKFNFNDSHTTLFEAASSWHLNQYISMNICTLHRPSLVI